jgi:4-amino-4-deoxy-L-arabinose transferase-like glycosyltransferase
VLQPRAGGAPGQPVLEAAPSSGELRLSKLRRLAPFLDARPRLFLVLLCLAFWLPGFFTLPPTDRDESRFTQATKQMLETGDFVRIMNGDVPRNRKPIGIHWLQAPFAAAARATGIAAANPVWPYRVPSLLGGIAAVLASYSLGLSLFANRRTALAAAGMLASCVILTIEAHIAKTDAALLGATTVAMAVLARGFMGLPLSRATCLLFWVACGAGILIKGPITPMVVALAAICGSAALGNWRWLVRLRPAWGVPVLGAVVAPWFIAIGIATHGAFFADAVGGDLGRKLAGGEESHGAFPGFHILLLPLLAFPATLPVLCGLHAAWRRRHARATIFLLSWLLPSWLVFEAVPTKLPHYTLPLYPALMLLAAAWLTEAGRPTLPSWLRRGAPVLAFLPACIIGVGGLALAISLHGSVWLGVLVILAAAPAAWFAARAVSPGRVPAAFAAAALLYTCVLGVALPHLQALWLAPRIEAALQRDWPGDTPLGTGFVAAGYAEPSLMFLAGTHMVLLPNGKGAADFLARSSDDAVLVTGEDVAAFLAEAARRHIQPRQIDDIDGVNYSRGRNVDLKLFLSR